MRGCDASSCTPRIRVLAKKNMLPKAEEKAPHR